MTDLRVVTLALAAVMSFAAPLAFGGGDDLPGESLYQLPVTLTTAHGESLKLSVFRHKPLVITMFYSQCASVCPLLTAQLQRVMGRLTASERRRVRVLMISFDSVRDTPETLAAFAAEHRIAGDEWVIARASEGDVRLLAGALGIQYRRLSDGTINHSSLISVTDPEGVVRGQTRDPADSNGTFADAIRRQLATVPRRSSSR